MGHCCSKNSVHVASRSEIFAAAATAIVCTRIAALRRFAEPEEGDTDTNKKIKALAVMLLLLQFDQHYLWKVVSHHFVEEGHLDMSSVLTSTTLPYLLHLLVSDAASEITSLDLSYNEIFADGEAGCLLGAGLSKMPQLRKIKMLQCQFVFKSFSCIMFGIVTGCHRLTRIEMDLNRVIDCPRGSNFHDATSESTYEHARDVGMLMSGLPAGCELSFEGFNLGAFHFMNKAMEEARQMRQT